MLCQNTKHMATKSSWMHNNAEHYWMKMRKVMGCKYLWGGLSNLRHVLAIHIPFCACVCMCVCTFVPPPLWGTLTAWSSCTETSCRYPRHLCTGFSSYQNISLKWGTKRGIQERDREAEQKDSRTINGAARKDKDCNYPSEDCQNTLGLSDRGKGDINCCSNGSLKDN